MLLSLHKTCKAAHGTPHEVPRMSYLTGANMARSTPACKDAKSTAVDRMPMKHTPLCATLFPSTPTALFSNPRLGPPRGVLSRMGDARRRPPGQRHLQVLRPREDQLRVHRERRSHGGDSEGNGGSAGGSLPRVVGREASSDQAHPDGHARRGTAVRLFFFVADGRCCSPLIGRGNDVLEGVVLRSVVPVFRTVEPRRPPCCLPSTCRLSWQASCSLAVAFAQSPPSLSYLLSPSPCLPYVSCACA